jgi:hypothetical protein
LAVEEFLNRQDTEHKWSKEVLDWQDVEGFELDRSEVSSNAGQRPVPDRSCVAFFFVFDITT